MTVCSWIECYRQADLALVLDMSGSTEEHHQMALMMSRRLVDRLDVGRQTRVAMLSFADHCTTHFNFNTYNSKSQVMSAVNIIPSHGRTNTQVCTGIQKSKEGYSSLQTHRYGNMPYGITQCYLPPGRCDIPAFTPAEAGTRFSDPGGMQG